MKLENLRPLLDHDGALTTVCLDVTKADEAGGPRPRHPRGAPGRLVGQITVIPHDGAPRGRSSWRMTMPLPGG
ncbi:MAG TPA: hypothetical protein PKB06_01435, partial [Actinotalea sp.]|nr:hypothetical protein [Actinotalea sp.]